MIVAYIHGRCWHGYGEEGGGGGLTERFRRDTFQLYGKTGCSGEKSNAERAFPLDILREKRNTFRSIRFSSFLTDRKITVPFAPPM